MTADDVDEARRAAADHDWAAAARAFEAADRRDGLTPVDLASWATASYLAGRQRDAIAVSVRAVERMVADGDLDGAVRGCFWLAHLSAEIGESAHATGWRSRARHLLAGHDDHPATRYERLLRAHRLIAVEDDQDAGLGEVDTAIALAREVGDRDVEALGLHLRGRALLRSGRSEDGLAELDGAMVLVLTGDLSPIVLGTVYCSLVEACLDVGAVARAEEWSRSLQDWARGNGAVPFDARCRIHRSSLLRLQGEVRAAEGEALEAVALLDAEVHGRLRGQAVHELAEAQRLRGRLGEAEESYERAGVLGAEIQPGHARLLVELGRPRDAQASLRRRLAERSTDGRRVALLAALVDAALAAGDVSAARRAATELDAFAARLGTELSLATSAFARGAIAVADGSPRDALDPLRRAIDLWSEVPSPYELARTQLLLATAYEGVGDDVGAAVQARAAHQALARMAVVAPVLAATPPPRATHGLTPRELTVLELLTTGATNREIAAHLHLSVKTVDRHVGSILSRLGVPTRTAAVAFAYEHRLV